MNTLLNIEFKLLTLLSVLLFSFHQSNSQKLNTLSSAADIAIVSAPITQGVMFGQMSTSLNFNSNSPNRVKKLDNTKDYSKLSFDINAGLPYLMSDVNSVLGIAGGIGARYSFNSKYSLQGAYTFNSFSGSSTPTGNQYVKSYKTTLNLISLNLLLNLRQLAGEPENLVKWNPYLTLGYGFLIHDILYTNPAGSEIDMSKLYTKPFRDIQLGIQIRKRLNFNWDLLVAGTYNFVETRYLDGEERTSTFDTYINPHIGLSYKVGAGKGKELIDYSYQNYDFIKKRSVPLEKVIVIEGAPIVKEESKVIDIVKETKKEDKTEPQKQEPVKVEQPKVVEPIKVEQPKVVEPVKVEQPKVVQPVVTPKAKSEPIQAKEPIIAQPTEGITPPPMKYNVIVGCYNESKADYAYKFKSILLEKGYTPSVYQDHDKSNMLRVSILSTDDRNAALIEMRKARKSLEPFTWIHIYNEQ